MCVCGGVAVSALKDPSALILRVQKEHEGIRMLTAWEVKHVTTASRLRRIESSGTETHYSNDRNVINSLNLFVILAFL